MHTSQALHGGDGKGDGQEVLKCPDSEKHDIEEDEESPNGANKKKEEDEVVTVMLQRCTPAAESPPPTIFKEIEEIFVRLGFNQMIAQKLVEDQGIDCPQTLAGLSDEYITTIYDIIRRPEGLIDWRALDRGNQISLLVTKNLKLAALIFISIECCSNT